MKAETLKVRSLEPEHPILIDNFSIFGNICTFSRDADATGVKPHKYLTWRSITGEIHMAEMDPMSWQICERRWKSKGWWDKREVERAPCVECERRERDTTAAIACKTLHPEAQQQKFMEAMFMEWEQNPQSDVCCKCLMSDEMSAAADVHISCCLLFSSMNWPQRMMLLHELVTSSCRTWHQLATPRTPERALLSFLRSERWLLGPCLRLSLSWLWRTIRWRDWKPHKAFARRAMTTTDQYATTGRDPCSRQIGEVKKKPEDTRATNLFDCRDASLSMLQNHQHHLCWQVLLLSFKEEHEKSGKSNATKAPHFFDPVSQ